MAAIGTTTAQSTGIGDTTPDQTQQNKNQPAGQLPYMQVNNTDNIIPLTKQAANPSTNGAQQPQQVTDTAQGNDAVLRAAQNAALNQGANPLTGHLTSQTSKYVADPNLGFDYKKYNQSALEDYDRQQSQAMEAARQKLAGTSQSGELKNQYLQNQMTASAGRQDLRAKNDYAAAQANQANMMNALAAGRATQAGNDISDTSRINNLINVRGAGEGERAQTQGFQDNVALTKMGFDHDTQMAAQLHGYDLEKLNTTYGLEATKAAIQHGYDLDTMAAQFGNEMAKLLATQDFEGAQAQLQRDFQAAAQTKDINATAANIQKQLDFDKWKQENGQEFTAAQTAINNALQLSLKNMDTNLQYNLMNMKAKIDEKALLTAQDFEAVQNALNREQQLAIQKNDTASQIQIETLKGQIAQQAQTAQNEFTKTLTQSTQAWQTGENIRKEDADKYMQALDIASREAINKNDTDTQKYIETQKANLQLQLQTQDMGQQEKMAYLNASIAEARATNDEARAENLYAFQTTQQLYLASNQGQIDEAKIQLQGDIQKALADKDYLKATALQKSQQTFEATQADKDRAIEQARVDLQRFGVDMQKFQSTYAALSAAADAGQIDPSTVEAFLSDTMKSAGVTVKPPDPDAAAKAIEQQYSQAKTQYIQTHPDQVSYMASQSDPASGVVAGQAYTAEQVKALASRGGALAQQGFFKETLSKDGLEGFNDFYNKNVYGEKTSIEDSALGSKIKTAASGDKIDVPTAQKDINGNEIPPGNYTIQKRTDTVAGDWDSWTQTNKQDTYDRTVLVDSKGVEHIIDQTKTGTSGGGNFYWNNILNPLSSSGSKVFTGGK